MEQPAVPTEHVALRAHEKWLARGCPFGDDKRDWFEAEEELRREIVGAPRPRPMS